MNLDWECQEFNISGLKALTPFLREDDRGYFVKSYEKSVYQQFGIAASVSETIESWSKYAVIRGLHFQTENPQAKIIRVLQGAIFDVAVDLRKNSKTFGKWKSIVLSSENHNVFYIPKGFAHGFQVLSEYALTSYLCIGEYIADKDTGINWKDIELGIEWPLREYCVSEKDKGLMSFSQFKETYGGLEGAE